MLIDGWMPRYDEIEHHEREVAAPPAATYETITTLDFAQSPAIRLLLVVRGVPHAITGRALPTGVISLESFIETGFVVLEEEPGEEIVLGAVGKFWMPTSRLLPITAERFRAFDEAGFAKATMNLRVEPLDDDYSRVITETRVACTDELARKRFKRYWFVVGPFSSLIRREMLSLVEKDLA